MTATRTPGMPIIEAGHLVSTSPATGEEVGRFPVAGADGRRSEAESAGNQPPLSTGIAGAVGGDVSVVVERARAAADWWVGLGRAGRRARLLAFRAAIASRIPELADLMRREGGKPVIDAVVEIAAAVDHATWAARNAHRVLRSRRVRSSLLQMEYTARVEYQPYGVVGVIGPWNYPVYTPMGSIAYALAAGNTVVFKPSEYTPAVGQWLVDRFAEVVPDQPVLQVVHGLGETGAALCRAGVDKVAFTGSSRTGRLVMAACVDTLTPVLLECGGKDAMIVDADADLDAAADAAVWGGLYNAGQTCVGIERVYVTATVADDFVSRLVSRASRLKVGVEADSTVGPITMPGQIDVIRRHIADAVEAGGQAALGGVEAVRPPYVHPTILVDVPEESAAVREETFGPVLVVNRVRDADEAIARANAVPYGLGGSVFARRGALSLARRMRSGMTSVNSVLSFAGMPSVPFGGVGESGFGRVHGDDGLREFSRAKSITSRRSKSLLPAATFNRDPAKTADRIARIIKLLHGRP
jgi:acyl-CoA reductase-like NAD-dependent aldehyde dehydrogenase